MKSPQKVKELLHERLNEALADLKNFRVCALLGYPDHYNVGDHLIWLGEVLYLTNVLGIKVNYAASIESFSAQQMEDAVGKAPILIHGGGNLGDLWSYYQKFYEKIVSQYHDRPIVILPQSIRFAYENRLAKAKDIFNAHPNLTLITRENKSYQLAKEHFTSCKVFKAPDTALEMVNLPDMLLAPKKQDAVLYLSRQDGELNPASSPQSIQLSNLIVDDWASYKYKGVPSVKTWQGIVRLLKEGWQDKTIISLEWMSRQVWQKFHPWVKTFDMLYNPYMHRKSWNFMHNGVYQFKQQRLIITNRLHGHILCLILGIPHVFLANSYHKNESFYQTWTYQIPFCRFVKEAEQIMPSVQELLKLNY
ncbi:MAG: polysaccharide polymerase [Cyanobacteria bacterium J083]|nr:MAG: polysaccharide polymerase [Cyanobacteria bacterium J083]